MNNNGASTFSTVPSIQSTSLNYSRTIPSSRSLSLFHLNSTHLNTFILFVCSWWCSSFRRYPKFFFFFESFLTQVVLSSSFNLGIMQIYLVNKLCWRTFTRGWIKNGWRNNTTSIGPASTRLSGCACCCFSYTVIYLLYMYIYIVVVHSIQLNESPHFWTIYANCLSFWFCNYIVYGLYM